MSATLRSRHYITLRQQPMFGNPAAIEELGISDKDLRTRRYMLCVESYGYEIGPYYYVISKFFPRPRLKAHIENNRRVYSIVSDDGLDYESIYDEYALPYQSTPLDAWREAGRLMRFHKHVVTTSPLENPHVRLIEDENGNIRLDKTRRGISSRSPHNANDGVVEYNNVLEKDDEDEQSTISDN